MRRVANFKVALALQVLVDICQNKSGLVSAGQQQVLPGALGKESE